MTPEPVKRKKVPLCKFLFTCLLLFFTVAAYSQTVDCENNCNLPECNFAANVEKGCRCFDGINNDGVDGFDKTDPKCATYYGLTFVGEGSDCDLDVPIVGSPFDLVGPPAVSGQNTADTQSKVAIGDVDADGVPDVVITSKWNSEIRVVATTDNQLDGSDAGDVKGDYNLDGSKIFSGTGACDPKNLLFEHEVLIANIDPTNANATFAKQSEIFGVVSNRLGSPKSPPTCFYLVGYRYGTGPGGLVPMYNAVNLGPNRPGTFGIADMDGDGKAEIYMRDRIYAAETGVLLATANGDWDLDITSGPVAVNVSGDNKMELVCGTKIFSIPSLTNRNPGSPAALTLMHDMNTITANKAYVKLMLDPVEYGEDTHSMCSVADLDLDGKVDVVISGALNSTSGPTAVFYWDVDEAKVNHFIVPDPSYANGWPWGTSRVNIGDVTGDSLVELSFIAGTRLFNVGINPTTKALTQRWIRTVNDSRSGVLTVTLYDFNNDGLNEMVYRDSQELVIIDGLTGQTKIWSATCQSHTYTEGPVIADANGDGGTDICVACNRNNSFNINADIQQQALGEVRMFYSSGNEWLPTRKVWNQPGYFVVNINDDLTLPFPQFDGATAFEGECDGRPGRVFPMNVFLNQVPFITEDGCPFFPQPDLAFYGDDPTTGTDTNGDGEVQPFMEVDPPYCGSKVVKVTFHLSNEGFLPIAASVPVAFYNGDPVNDPNSTFLYTTNLNVNLAVGDTTSAIVSFNGPGPQFTLFAVLNNSGDKTAIVPTTTDCRLANNIQQILVTPKLFDVTAIWLADNITCDPADKTGAAKVNTIKNGINTVTDWSTYSFQWYSGPAIGPLTALPGETNYLLDNVVGGTYSVIVKNTAVPQSYCTSTPQEVIIKNGDLKPVFTVTATPQTTCTPFNGTVTANFGGQSTVGLNLVWYNLNNEIVGQGVTSLNGLKKDYYYLIATNVTCPSDPVGVNVAGPESPDGQAILINPVQNCIDPSSGKITVKPYQYPVAGQIPIADADTVKYTFAWYNYDNSTNTQGSMLAPGIAIKTPTRDVEEGSYSVVITDVATKCSSTNLIKIDVGNTLVIPTADIDVIKNQTSCDPNNPNGEFLGIALENGLPAVNQSNYHFFWYLGQNTLTKLKDTNGNVIDNPTLTGVKGGGQMYTLQVVSKTQDCEATFASPVPDLPIIPLVTLDSVNNTSCTTPIGSVTAKIFMSGTETINYGLFSFNWDKGSTLTGVNPTPNATSNLLSTQPAGYYTLQVTDIATTCKSVPVNIEVLDRLNYPDAIMSAIPSTNCTVPANAIVPNGSADVSSIDGNPVPNNGTFTFAWFNGLDETSPVVPAVNSKTLANRQGPATFSVKITNTTNGCTSLTPVQIADNSVVPVITLSPVDNDICNQALTSPLIDFKGSVTPTITNQGANPISDYSFSWFNKEFGANTVAGAWTKLDSGIYTLSVTHKTTGCQSSLVSAQVKNLTTVPFIEAIANGSTNCAPAVSGNGSVKVNEVNSITITAASPFKFKWFKGQDLTGTLVTSSFETTATLQGGASEFYTVQVTDNSNGCQNTQTVQLPDNSALPILTLDQDPNTKCAGFNGEASIVTVTYKGTDITNGANLGYKWYNGIGAVPANIRTETSTNLTGLQNNVFVSATVTMTTLGCTSDFEAIEIQNGIVLPTLTPSAIGSKNCTNVVPSGVPDGSATVLAAPADTYDFKWYSGNTVGAAGTEVGTAATLSGQQGGSNAFFTVLVTSQTTLCSSNATALITDDSQIPVVDPLTPTNNPNCPAFPNGTVNAPAGKVTFNGFTYRGAVIASPYTDYTFIWTGPNAPAPGANIPQLNNVGAGGYSLQIQNNTSKCISDPVPATVIDALVYPDIDNAVVEQTSCDVNAPNGSITSTVGGGTAGFAFEWFNGIGTAGTTVTETSEGFIQNLISANYTVRVHNTTTACTSTESLLLPDLITYPDLNWVNVLPLTRCDVPNGEATPAVTNASATFTIFRVITLEGGTYPIDPLAIIAGGTPQTDLSKAANLTPGFVTGVVRNEVTKCVSSPATVEIENNIDQASIQLTPSAKASNCDPSTPGWTGGGIDLALAGGIGGYEFRWYRGTPVNTNINFYNNPPDMGAAPQVNTNIGNPNLGIPNGGPPDNVLGFSAGIYTVVVTDLGNGCGAYDVGNIPLLTSPGINITESPNTKCVGPDGQMQVSLTTIAAGPYQLNLYTGNNSSGTLVATNAGANPSLNVSGLLEGSYFVELVDNTLDNGVLINASCPIGEGALIIKETYDPIVSLTLKEANTSCDPANSGDGEVDVKIIPHSLNPPAHTFEIFQVSPSPIGFAQVDNLAGNSTTTLGGFGPLSYTVQVRDEVSLCEGEGFITIPDQPVVPEILTVVTTPDTYCAPLTNGAITITSVSPGAVNEYDYSWSDDPNLTTVLFGPDASNVYNSTKTGWKTGAVAGAGNGDHTYYVQGIKKTGDGVGCPTPIVMAVVNDAHVTPVLKLSSTPDTSCEGTGEGTVSILASTTSTDPAVANSLYKYLFNTGTFDNMNGAVADVHTNIGDGNYPVVATNIVSQCVTQSSVSVDVFTFPLLIIDSDINNQMICTNDGEVLITNIEFNTGVVVPYDPTDYGFQWFKAPAGSPGSFDPNAPLTDSNSDVIAGDLLTVGSNAGQYPLMEAGTYYVIAKRLDTTTPGAGCPTPPYRVDVLDKHENPAVQLTPFSDTSCDGSGEGSIKVLISSDIDPTKLNVAPPSPFTYEYTWTGAQAVTVPGPSDGDEDGLDGDGDNPQSLIKGAYSLAVKNLFTNCTITGATTITLNETPVFIADVDSLNQTFCTPLNGSVTVTRVDAQYPSGLRNAEPLNDFQYTWTKPDGTTTVTPLLTLPDLGAGSYFVVAKRTASSNNGPGVGCMSAPRRIEVLDKTFLPNVALTPFSDTGCSDDEAFFEGSIRIDASDNAASAGVGGPYNYFWASADATNTSVVLGTTTSGNGVANLQKGLRDDIYTITVTNSVTGCFVKPSTEITKSKIPVIILSASATPKLICKPDGSAQVDQVTVGGNGDGNFNNFDFVWYEAAFDDNNIVLNGQNESLIDETKYIDFTKNSLTYFVKAIRRNDAVNPDLTPAIGRGCESLPVSVIVPDNSVDPVLTFDVTENSHCNPALSNASVTALAEEPDGTQDAYQFTWVKSDGTTLALATNILDPAMDDVYSVTALNTLTGCPITNTVEVIRDLTLSQPNIVDVRGVDATDCFATGEAQVFFVTIGGSLTLPGSDPRFDYEWFTTDPSDPSAQPIPSVVTDLYSNVKPGDYFVQLIDTDTECQSGPTQVTVNKCQNCFVEVDITQTLKQINCLTASNDFTGQLAAVALNHNGVDSNTTPADFVFTWFNALDTVGTIYDNNDLSTISNLKDGDYAVRVVDVVTNCRGKEYYIIQDDANLYKPELLLSPVARQTCGLLSDGALLIQQVADVPYNSVDYPFFPDYTASITGEIPDVPATDPAAQYPLSWYAQPLDTISAYTVVLIDNNTKCEVTQTIMIPSNINYPTISINVDNPLQACDDAKANGQFSALADGGQLLGYTFDWFAGQWTKQNPPDPTTAFIAPTAQDNMLIGVGRGESTDLFFTVKVTNNATQCASYEKAQLTESIIYPITVQAELIQNDMHCVLDEGWVRGYVVDDNGDPQVAGYNFYWFDQAPSDSSPAGLEAAISGKFVMKPDTTQLDAGTYYLIAEDINTGCPALASVVVEEILEIPDMVFKTTASYCADVPAIVESGKGTGSIELSLEPTSIVSDSIVWYDLNDNIVGSGNYVVDLLPGEYQAFVTTNKGCTNQKSAKVPTEILSYNLVTQNGDNKNDKFVVDCLSFFPNNNVKIFNRSGVLVYEGDYYDNVNTFFDGIGKNGIYMTGNVLPVGTYFYIIDKGDGSKPRTGYLELVR